MLSLTCFLVAFILGVIICTVPNANEQIDTMLKTIFLVLIIFGCTLRINEND